MSRRNRRVTAIAGVFYVGVIIGDGIIAAYYAFEHDMPWVATGVGLLALVPLFLVVRILKRQFTAEGDG